ncbi:CFEM domain-containing protein [Aspergillus mulundensis]|uniref:CFEM domain-containing protein n=1 Tax=Aspergillus mulundensis TaxID=1810919 RepID=A0A3D8QF54_9EURO|nr:hypothetical protein DSM5745_10913 [Aspergillus mulundensis]RDW60455.1 hypothetical protein DSM5745_10913 [Aspergillus mulundensis]
MEIPPDVPTCALTCLISAIGNSTCSFTDLDCVCGDAQLNAQSTACVLGSCSVMESLTAKNMTYTLCQYPYSDDTHVFPVTNIVGIVVAIVSVAMRLTSRAMDKRLGWDDLLIFVALLFAAAISGIGIKLKDTGLGKDIWAVPFDDIRKTLKLFFIEEELYGACIAIVKCSMLMLYLRLFPNRGLRIAVYITLTVTIMWGLGAVFVLLGSCQPISHYWNEWDGEHEGKCISQNDILLAHSIINILLDVVITIMPLPIVVKLHMPLGKRLGVMLMFGVGIVVTIISIMRLVKTVGFNSTQNPTKDFVPVGIWSLLEFDVAIMCACMPAIRTLFIRLFKPPTDTYAYGSNRYNYKGSGASGSHSGNGSRARYSTHIPSKAHNNPPNLDSVGGIRLEQEFIRLEEVEGEDADADAGWSKQDTHHSYEDARSHSAAQLVRKGTP